MNKIQLRAAFELAEMNYNANQTEQNKAALEAAKKAFEDFDKPAKPTELKKPTEPAEPQKPVEKPETHEKKATEAKKADKKQEKAEPEQKEVPAEAPVDIPSEEKKTE